MDFDISQEQRLAIESLRKFLDTELEPAITAHGEGLALFLDKRQLLAKLEHDEGFGSRFYRALAVFLADRLRATRQPTAERLSDGAAVSRDELDIGIMDHVTAAGERFNRMLRVLRLPSAK